MTNDRGAQVSLKAVSVSMTWRGAKAWGNFHKNWEYWLDVLMIRANGYRPRAQKMPGAASPEQCLLTPAPPYSVALAMTFRCSQTAVPTLQLPALLDLLAAGGRPLALSLRWRQDSGTRGLFHT